MTNDVQKKDTSSKDFLILLLAGVLLIGMFGHKKDDKKK